MAADPEPERPPPAAEATAEAALDRILGPVPVTRGGVEEDSEFKAYLPGGGPWHRTTSSAMDHVIAHIDAAYEGLSDDRGIEERGPITSRRGTDE